MGHTYVLSKIKTCRMQINTLEQEDGDPVSG